MRRETWTARHGLTISAMFLKVLRGQRRVAAAPFMVGRNYSLRAACPCDPSQLCLAAGAPQGLQTWVGTKRMPAVPAPSWP